MAVRFYDGSGVVTTATSRVTIKPKGYIYVGALLYSRIPEQVKYVKLGVDDETRELVIRPCDGQDKGRSRFVRNTKARQGCRMNCKIALLELGILPAGDVMMDGEIRGGDIRARLPDSMFNADGDKAAEPAELVRQPEPQGSTAAKDESVEPRCCTCQDFAKLRGQVMFGTCRLKHGASMRADQTEDCHSQKRRKPETSTPPTQQIHQGSRPRGDCPRCGGNFPVSARGLARHDVNGVMYTGGRGDMAHPCPGSHGQPKS